jgi:hypothetical protein
VTETGTPLRDVISPRKNGYVAQPTTWDMALSVGEEVGWVLVVGVLLALGLLVFLCDVLPC